MVFERRGPRRIVCNANRRGGILPCHKSTEGLATLIEAVAAVVTVVGKTNNRCTELCAIDWVLSKESEQRWGWGLTRK